MLVRVGSIFPVFVQLDAVIAIVIDAVLAKGVEVSLAVAGALDFREQDPVLGVMGNDVALDQVVPAAPEEIDAVPPINDGARHDGSVAHGCPVRQHTDPIIQYLIVIGVRKEANTVVSARDDDVVNYCGVIGQVFQRNPVVVIPPCCRPIRGQTNVIAFNPVVGRAKLVGDFNPIATLTADHVALSRGWSTDAIVRGPLSDIYAIGIVAGSREAILPQADVVADHHIVIGILALDVHAIPIAPADDVARLRGRTTHRVGRGSHAKALTKGSAAIARTLAQLVALDEVVRRTKVVDPNLPVKLVDIQPPDDVIGRLNFNPGMVGVIRILRHPAALQFNLNDRISIIG